jgi:outer membrane protein TolC
MPATRLAVAWASLFLAAGCTTLSPDGGFGPVQTLVRERAGVEARWVRSDRDAAEARKSIEQLLATPLTADAAVQVALINNRGLQATYAEVGIAEADMVQAGRMRNPGFSYGRLRRGDEIEIERAFLFDVLALITMPLRTQIEQRRFELVKTRVAAETLRVAADVRRTYYRALAAQEGVKYMQQVRDAAEASAELARRMAVAGNFSKLDQAREQLFYAETIAQFARVRQAALSEREQLTRMMGLWGQDIGYRLPERLPDLPKTADELSDIEPAAMKQRLDVQVAMQDAQSIAANLGLTRATGFVSVLELAYLHNNESGQPRQIGYEIELRLPIFDWGDARTARAELSYMQAVSRASEIAVKARSEVREAYGAYRTSFDLARHYRDEIVPLRKRISEKNVLLYNGMLVSVFELLADARQQVTSVNAYIEALRDFWVAEATLRTAMTGTSPGAIGMARSGAAQAAAAEPAGGH